MRVPFAEAAEVPLRKVMDYLLNAAHPDAADKARFFLTHSFSAARPQELISALLLHVREHEVVNARTTRFGVTYAVGGPLVAPDGQSLVMRSVWIIERGDTIPRLITAYPAK